MKNGAVTLPVIFAVPEIFAPVLVTFNTLATPPTPTVTFPPDEITCTLLVPLLILAGLVSTPVR